MIVFASDNGVNWGGTASLPPSSGPLRRVDSHPARRPLRPRHDAPGRDHHLILNTDWAPTWAALADVHHPGTEGLDFLPLLRPGHRHVHWRSGFLLEGWDKNPPTADPSYCGIRAQNFIYTEYGDGSRELYDTRTDPWRCRTWRRTRPTTPSSIGCTRRCCATADRRRPASTRTDLAAVSCETAVRTR